MTEGQTVEAGNTLDLNFSTSNIAGGVPPGWGETCEAYIIGPVNGGCYRYRSFDLSEASVAGYDTTFECLIADFPDVESAVNTIAICKAYYLLDGTTPGTLGDAARCWRIFIQNPGGYWRFLFMLGEDPPFTADEANVAWPSHTEAPGIQLGQVYTVRVVYDLINGRVSGYVDGVLAGTMTNAEFAAGVGHPMPPTVAHQILGSSSSSDGRNVTFLLDNITFQEFVPAMPDIVVICAAG